MADAFVLYNYTVENNTALLRLDDFVPGVFIGLETKSAHPPIAHSSFSGRISQFRGCLVWREGECAQA